jgi:FKBP-type peptidyl-prolyl cis-trans isomerase
VPRVLTAIALVSAAIMLSACQSPPAPDVGENGCVATQPGAASDSIRVSGGSEGAAPSARFERGLSAYRTERTVVTPGTGRVATDGALVTFAYAAFNGASGDEIDVVGYDSPFPQATVDETSMLAGLRLGLACGQAGSRLAVVVPPVEGFGAGGDPQHGIGPTDAIVFVIDVVAVAGDRADGENQPAPDGLPAVEVGATGEPRVSIPALPPPGDLTTAVLKLGAGEQVTEGATVTIEYRGLVWATGRTFDSSWREDELVRRPTTSFIPGIAQALVGSTVGSQLLVVVPPAFGYGQSGSPQFGILASDTLVYVIDVLAVVQPPATPVQE